MKTISVDVFRLFWEKTCQKMATVFSKRNLKRVAKFFWPLLAVAAVFLTAYVITGANPSANARVWYFAGIIAYVIIGGVIISEANETNIYGFIGTLIKDLFIINIIFIVASFFGVILALFIHFPPAIQAILGWPAIVSFIIFIILTLGIVAMLATIGLSAANDLEYEGY